MNKFTDLLKRIWKRLHHNIALKALSLLLAILIWNFVVSSNSSYTRTKTVQNLTGYVSGQTVLNGNGLALATDPSEALSDVLVMVEVAQSEYSYVSAENVQVTLNVGNVTTEGTKEVALRAVTSYGKVVDLYPSSVTLTFEPLDSREVPVNVQMDGGEDMWYDVAGINPGTITVSGAKSRVQSIASAYVSLNMEGITGQHTSTAEYTFTDSTGKAVDGSMLSVSSSSVSLSVLAYPKKELTVNAASSITGSPAPGFVVKQVTVQPETVSVAAEEGLLSGLTEIKTKPISVEGANQSFSVAADLVSLSDLHYVSSGDVIVTVEIEEETSSAWVDDVEVNFVGKSDALQINWDGELPAVYVTGPKSAVDALVKDGLSLTADLTGLTAGTHRVRIALEGEDTPLSFEPDEIILTIVLVRSRG